ncbi:hypothetical protein vseg_005666 [Gypsophila vaccaria]
MSSYRSPSSKPKTITRHHSSPFPTCFRPPSPSPSPSPNPQPPSPAASPNLTTSLYQSNLGLFSVTWSRSLFSRSLHLLLHPSSPSPTPPPTFHLALKPFAFWSKHGHKKFFTTDFPLLVVWDFTRARFGAGPEPVSGYYIAVFSPSSSSTLLFVGDLLTSYLRNHNNNNNKDSVKMCESSLVVRREHVCGAQFYTTKTTLGGKAREILIEVNKHAEDDPRLVIRFDSKRVIQVKHLKWKFRGSERFEVDGHRVQLSWDVYNWLFDDVGCGEEGYALFTFRFEAHTETKGYNDNNNNSYVERGQMWSQDSCGLSYERKKMKKRLVVKTSSSSSSSLSSASSSGSSSVMEWESVEENELKAPTGFSLLVYAWKN